MIVTIYIRYFSPVAENMSSRFSSLSEANASERLENHEEVFPGSTQ